ncbi:MAG: PTS transporter subunit EIIC, partial [Oscillospiraceae bacterium]
KFPFMIFGLPGAALAMYMCARDSKKKVAGGLLLSAAVTAMLTGITEPLEFTFLFVAPVLYAIHCVLAGLSFMLMHVLNVTIGMTFSGGIIDFVLFGIMQGTAKTNWMMMLPVGVGYFAIYFMLFKYMIKKFDYITPGREPDVVETKLYNRSDYNEKKSGVLNKKAEIKASPQMIVEALGGEGNIINLDSCATRLRVTVADSERVDEVELKATGAAGVIKKGNGIQVIYGPRVTVIKSEIEEYLE